MVVYVVLQRRYELRRKDPERLSEEVHESSRLHLIAPYAFLNSRK